MEVKREKCIVIAIPTQEVTNIVATSNSKFMYGNFPIIPIDYSYQHLYIVEKGTESIFKKGEYYWYSNIGSSLHEKSGIYKSKTGKEYKEGMCSKVIATTNSSLTILSKHTFNNDDGGFKTRPKQLPKPSKAFLQKYCKLDGIDEVLVEYLSRRKTQTEVELEGLSEGVSPFGVSLTVTILKVDSNNEITIHPAKNSYNRQEVIDLCNSAHKSGELFGIQFVTTVDKSITRQQDFEEWLKDNM